jgi:mRNA interferase MazF
MRRGEIWWVDLGNPRGSEAGFERPVIVVQSDTLNRTRLPTVLVIPLTTNLMYADVTGNLLLESVRTGLDHDSIAQTHLMQAVPLEFFLDRIGRLKEETLGELALAIEQTLELID